MTNLHTGPIKATANDGTLNGYQVAATATAIYPGQGTMLGKQYCLLKMNGEAGELAEKVGKMLRDHGGALDEERRHALGLELGDVLWYVANFSAEHGYTLLDIAYAGTIDNGFETLDAFGEQAINFPINFHSEQTLIESALWINVFIAEITRDVLMMPQRGVKADEICGVLDHIVNAARILGYKLSEIANMNIEKLTSRQARGKLSGSGDNR